MFYNRKNLSFIYAYNLFMYAKKYNILHTTYIDVRLVYYILTHNLSIKEFIIKRESHILFEKNFNLFFLNFTFLVKKFLHFIILKRKLYLLKYVCGLYINMYKEYYNIIDVFIYTSCVIDNEINHLIIQKLGFLFGYNNYHIHNIINEKIVGGFILYINNIKLDITINNKINQLFTLK